MKLNRAIESCPSTWDDKKLERATGLKVPTEVPEEVENPERYWASTIGKEVNGIRCIVSPSMSTLIGDQFDFVAIDEAHKMQNLDSQLTNIAIRMQPRFRYALTATPIGNIVSNLFPLMGWICCPGWYKGDTLNAAWPYRRQDLGKFNEVALTQERDLTQERLNAANAAREALSNPGGKFKKPGKCIKVSPVIASPARLLKLLKPNMAYIDKPDCSPSYRPPKVTDIRVPMGIQQTRLYAHFMNRANIPCSNPLIRARKQIAYLRGICADPAGFEHGGPSVRSNFNPKMLAILQLTQEKLKLGEQVVIISARVGQTNSLHVLLREAGVKVARIDSTVPASEHSHQSNHFKQKKVNVMLMGIKCAQSYSWDQCQNLIVGSLEYSYGSLHQAVGRIDRITNPGTNIYCILHKHSIEETMYDVVATKQDAATICLRGQRIARNFKPVDFGEVIALSMSNFNADASIDETECQKQWPQLKGMFQL